MSLRHGLFCVNTFDNRTGTANPAGICKLGRPPDPVWMQTRVREMNLSYTAFVVRIWHGFSLRWFTPRGVIEQAGHPPLATAHILWERIDIPARIIPDGSSQKTGGSLQREGVTT